MQPSGSSARVRAVLAISASRRSSRLSVAASISGSGQMQLSGSTKTLSAGVSGSGRIEANDLKASTCEARVSGSGNCRVNVAETLDAHISGSGNVYYQGSPKVTSRVSGSGRADGGIRIA